MEMTQCDYKIDLTATIDKKKMESFQEKKEYFKELNINMKTIAYKNNVVYHILQYDKSFINSDNISDLGLFRSVILDENFDVLSFAPPKSDTQESIDLSKGEHLKAEMFVEGTMINLFYEQKNNEWIMATRSTIGANVKFYLHSENTFREMFLETFNDYGISFDDLDKKLNYSFILQHKGNKIVVPVEQNKIYLASCNEISNNKITYIYNPELLVKFPSLQIPTYEWDKSSLEPLIDSYASGGKTDYKVLGFVIKNVLTGSRYKNRNPQYETVRKLRGNQAKDQYNYFALRHSGNIKDYLKYYPEDKKKFSLYRDLLHKSTNNLYKLYQECYIYKKAELKTYSPQYRTHMFKLHHEEYMIKLKPESKTMNMTSVIEYVNKLHPSILMHFVNYDLRKNN